MGLIFVGLVLLVFGVLVCLGIYKAFKTVPIVNKLLKMIANKVLFNAFIRTFIAGFLVFALSAFKNLT